MKRKLPASEKLKLINAVRAGQDVSSVCQTAGISRPTFYAWQKAYNSSNSSTSLTTPNSFTSPKLLAKAGLASLTPKHHRHYKSLPKSIDNQIIKTALNNPQLSILNLSKLINVSQKYVWTVLKKNDLNTQETRQAYLAKFGNKLRRMLTAHEKLRLLNRLKSGESITSLSQEFGISRTIIYKWQKVFDQAGSTEKITALNTLRPQGHQHYRFNDQIRDLILQIIIKTPELTLREIEFELQKMLGNGCVSLHTVYNVLKQLSLSTYQQRLDYIRSSRPSVSVATAPSEVQLPAMPQYSFNSFLSPPPFKKLLSNLKYFSLITSFIFISTLAILFILNTFSQMPSLGAKIGLIFSFSALLFGMFFFVYSLKYYLTIGIVLSFSRQRPGEGKGSIWSRIFGFSITIEDANQLVGRGTMPGAQNAVGANNYSPAKGIGLQADLSSVVLERLPFVSIHLSTYNEKRVIDRLLTAATSMDYPNYEVIVADDSTDETVQLLERWRNHPRIKISHRESRTGYKGGALQQALNVTDPRAEFILVFDADFIPYPDSITQFLKYFQASAGTLQLSVFGSLPAGRQGQFSESGQSQPKADRPLDEVIGQSVSGQLKTDKLNSDNRQLRTDNRIAAVQGYQWHVLNKSENWITRGVRSEYAGSYVIERSGTELYSGLKQISGSVYMIRRDVLQSIGWGTSITEDFELTLKLYEQGYKVVYTPYIQAPAEAVSTIKRLIRQRMRWAEGHSFNVKRMFAPLLFGRRTKQLSVFGSQFSETGQSVVGQSVSDQLKTGQLNSDNRKQKTDNRKAWLPSPLTLSEKLEFLYLSPYYLQAAFFILGTLSWFIAEAVFRVQLPFWTEVWGWSLVLTNLFALPLMNLVGLFMEESSEKDYLGLFSFLLLSYIVAPFQAYAAVKGFVEKGEGPWFRTPKTGRITDSFLPGRISRFVSGLFGRGIIADTFQLKPAFGTQAYLLLTGSHQTFDSFAITPKHRRKWLGKSVLAILLIITSLLVSYAPYVPSMIKEANAFSPTQSGMLVSPETPAAPTPTPGINYTPSFTPTPPESPRPEKFVIPSEQSESRNLTQQTSFKRQTIRSSQSYEVPPLLTVGRDDKSNPPFIPTPPVVPTAGESQITGNTKMFMDKSMRVAARATPTPLQAPFVPTPPHTPLSPRLPLLPLRQPTPTPVYTPNFTPTPPSLPPPVFADKLQLVRKSFRAADPLELDVTGLITADYQVEVFNYQKQKQTVSIQDQRDLFSHTLSIRHGNKFSPGVYTVRLTDKQHHITQQQVAWGVLVFNSNKSIYTPGETAYLQMATLTDTGRTLCDAKLELTVTAPDNQITHPKIQKSQSCSVNNVTDQPDYFSYYKTIQTGTYQIKLTNLQQHYDISDSFTVKDSVPFIVERVAATRINPFKAAYTMTLKIKANQDFNGVVKEKLPEGFTVFSSKCLVQSGKCTTQDSTATDKNISWNLDVKRGDSSTLSYTYQAPRQTPYVYYLGPLSFILTSPPPLTSPTVFTESRQWELASDNGFDCTAAASGNWQATPSTTYWTGCNNTYPQTGDRATLSGGSLTTTVPNGETDSILAVRIDGNSAVLTVNGTLNVGGTGSFTAGITLEAAAGVAQSGTINGSGTINTDAVYIGTLVTPSANTTNFISSSVSNLVINGSSNLTVSTYHSGSFDWTGQFRQDGGTVTVPGAIAFVKATTNPVYTMVNTASNAGTLNLSGATPFTGTGTFTAYAATCGTTVNYSAASASVNVVAYQNLTLSGTNPSISTLATVHGNLLLSAGSTSSVTTGAALVVDGTTTINASNTLSVGAFNITVTGATTISGSLSFASATGTKTFAGLVTITGTWDDSSTNAGITLTGGLTNNGTFTSGTGTYTLNGNQTIGGGNAITFSGTGTGGTAPVQISGTVTVQNSNTNTVTISGDLTGSAGGSTWQQNANSYLKVAKAVLSTGTLTASANSNTVEYTAGSQTIKGATYWHLVLSGASSPTTAGGALTVNGDFTIGGATSFAGGTSLTHTFLGNWIVNTSIGSSPYTFATGGTVNFNTPGTPAATSISGSNGQTIAFNVVNINNTSGFSTSHNISASGNLTVTANATLTPSSGVTVSGTGTLTGNGTAQVTKTSGTNDFAGQYTITAKTLTNLTIDFVGTSAQQVDALTTYSNLMVRPSANSITTTNFATGTVTLSGSLTIGNGTNTGVIVTAATNDPNINVGGSMSVATNTTFTSTDNSVKTLAITGSLTINGTFIAPNGTTATTLTIGGDFANNGTFTHSSGRVTFNKASGTQNLTGTTGTTTFYQLYMTGSSARTVTFQAGNHYAIANNGTITLTGATGQLLTLASSTGSSKWYLDVSSTGTTVTVQYVSVSWSDASGGKQIDASDGTSTNGGNTVNWKFSLTLSGKIYQTNEATVYDCSAHNETVTVAVNGTVKTTANCTLNTGAWSASSIILVGGDIVNLYISAGSTRIDAELVYVSDATTQSNLNLFQSRLILRQDYGSGITNSNLSTGYVSATGVLYTVSGGNLTVNSGIETHLLSGNTFAPGGNVNTDFLHVQGIYSGSSETLTLTGSGQGTSRPLFIDNGTFTAPATTAFTGSSASDIEPAIYNALQIKPGGTVTHYLMSGTTTVNGAFTAGDASHSGTVDASGDSVILDINGDFTNSTSNTFKANAASPFTISGSFTQSGTFTANSGTVTFDSTATSKTLSGTLTSSSAFYNLTFNGTNGGWALSNDATVTNYLSVTNGTFDEGSKNLTVSGGNVFTSGSGVINCNSCSAGTTTVSGTGQIGGGPGAGYQYKKQITIDHNKVGLPSLDNTSNSTVTGSPATSLTWSHTTGTQTNRLLIVNAQLAGNGSATGTVTGITYAGISLTKAGGLLTNSNGVTNEGDAELWYLVNPPTGANNVVISSNATYIIDASALTYYNVDTTNPIGSVATISSRNNSGGSSHSVTVNNTSTNQIVVDSMNDDDYITPGTGQTQVVDTCCTIISGATSYKTASNGSTTMSWTDGAGGQGYWAQVAVAINPAPLINFPVLISESSDANLKTAANSGQVQSSSGYDIIFTDSNNTTKLDHEIEKYVATTGEIEMWVRIPYLSASSDTTINMYYGNNTVSTSQENRTGVWNPGGATTYRGVWHFAESGGSSSTDSTSYGSTAAQTGTASLGNSGKIGYSLSTPGSGSNYFSVTDPADGHLDFNASNSFSECAWVYVNASTGTWQSILDKGGDGSADKGYTLFTATNATGVAGQIADGTNTAGNTYETISTGAWKQACIVIDRSAQLINTYVNGVQANTPQSISSVGDLSNSYNYYFGISFNGSSTPLNGKIDEVEVQSRAITVGWITTEYSNQNSPSTFLTFGSANSNVDISAGYQYKKQITIDHTKVQGGPDLLNFPVLISATGDTNLKDKNHSGHVQSTSGYDIIFTDQGTNVKLDHEIEQYDGTNGTIAMWVRVPAVSAKIDTVINMYYDNSTITGSQENKTGVWNSNFKGVWHLGESSGIPTDSTSYGSNGAITGSITQGATGKFGTAYSYSGAGGDYIKVTNPGDSHLDFGSSTSFSYSSWVYTNTSPTLGNYFNIIGKGSHGSTPGYISYVNSDPKLQEQISDGTNYTLTNSYTMPNTQWVHEVTVIDRSANLLHFYINGTEIGTGGYSTSSVASVTSSDDLYVGTNASGNSELNGKVQEIEINNTALSAGWVTTEYNNQNSPSTFATFTSEATNAVSGASVTAYTLAVSGTEKLGADTTSLANATIGTGNSLEINNNNLTVAGNLSTTTTGVITCASCNTGTVTMSGSSKTIGAGAGGKISAYDLTVSGSVSLASDLTILNDALVTNGGSFALASYNLAIQGGDLQTTGNGAVTCSSCTNGTTTITGTGNVGGRGGWYNTGYLYKKQITLDHTKVGNVSLNATPTFMESGTDATQDLSFYSSVNGLASSDTSIKHTGSRSLKFNGNNPAAYATVTAPAGSINSSAGRISMYIYFTNLIPNADIVDFNANATYVTHPLSMNGTNNLGCPGGTYGSTPISTGTWYRISIAYSISGSTLTQEKVYINGNLEVTCNSVGMSASSPDRAIFGIIDNTQTSKIINIDDIYIDNGSDMSDPGDIRITAKRPIANGAANNFGTQIGTGSSGYGSGHSLQVNEQPLSNANGWSTTTTQRENYIVEGPAVGDVDLSNQKLLSSEAWIDAKTSSGTCTAQITNNGTDTAKTLSTTETVFTNAVASTTYPSNQAMTGIQSCSSNTTSLYEAGLLIAYTPPVDLTNFPVLISRTDPDLRTTGNGGLVQNASGYDIVFTASDNTTKLDHEIEKYDPTTGQIVMWVRIPTLSASVDTTIYLYFDNSSISIDPSVTGVWDSNFKGVWHLKEDPTGSSPQMKDSTSNAHNGTTAGSFSPADQQAAKIAGGLNFNGIDDTVDTGNSMDYNSAQGTWELWYNPGQNAVSWGEGILMYDDKDNDANDNVAIRYDSDNTISIYNRVGSETFPYHFYDYSTLTAPLNTWSQIVIVQNGISPKIYINGVLDSSAPSGSALSAWTSALGQKYFSIDRSSGTAFNKAKMDEVRVSNTARSFGWIATEYANQSSPSSFTKSIGQTVPYTATITGSVTVYDLAVNGTQTLGTALTAGHNAAVLSGASLEENNQNVTVSGGSLQTLGSGTITCASCSAGTTTLSGTGNLGGYWWDKTYLNRAKITLNNSASTTDLTDFPALVKLNASRITYANFHLSGSPSVPQDIRFVDSDGTPLKYEIESWNTSGDSFVWVKVPKLPAFSTTKYIYVYYNNASVSDGQDKNNVWTNGFGGVWHLGETTGTQYDSTGNANNSTAVSVTTQGSATGQIDGADAFTGSSGNKVTVNHSASLVPVDLTTQAWIKLTSLPSAGNYYAFDIKRAPTSNQYNFLVGDDGTVYMQWWNTTGTNYTAQGQSTISSGNWYLLTGVHDSKTNTNTVYINRTSGSPFTANGTLFNGSDTFEIGNSNTSYTPAGVIDEVRVSDIARSPDWIAADYINQTDSMNTYGSEEAYSVGAGGTVSTYSLAANGTTTQGADVITGSDVAIGTGDSLEMNNFNLTSAGNLTTTTSGQVTCASCTAGTLTMTGTSKSLGAGSGGSITTFNLTGKGSITLTSDITVKNDSLVTNGASLDLGSKNFTVQGGDILTSGTGAVTCNSCTAGTTTLSGTGQIGGVSSWYSDTNYLYRKRIDLDHTKVIAWAPVIGQSVSGAQSAAGSTFVLNLSSGTTQNNRLILSAQLNALGAGAGNAAMTVSDDKGNTWTKHTESTHWAASTYDCVHEVWSAPQLTGGASQITLTYTGPAATVKQFSASVQEYSGLSTSTGSAAIDVSAVSNSTANGSANSGNTAATTASNELVIGGYSDDGANSGTVTAGTGYTVKVKHDSDSTAESAIEEMNSGASGSVISATISGYRDWGMSAVVFKLNTTGMANFPVLISRTDTDLRTTGNGGYLQNSSGYDLIFTDTSGTKLDHEIEKYVANTGEIEMWVRIPQLSGATDTTIYMYYDNSTISTSQENKTGVWNSNFKGVWHLKESSGTTNSNSTSTSSIDATKASAIQPNPATGKIDGGQQYNNSGLSGSAATDYDAVPDNSALNFGASQDFTVSAWVKTSQGTLASTWPMLVSKEDGIVTRQGYNIVLHNGIAFSVWYFEIYVGGSAWQAYGTGNIADGNWHYVVGKRAGSYIYSNQDGAVANNTSASSGSVSKTSALDFGTGSGNPNSENLNGALDEVHIANVALSDGWIATEYNDQNSPATFAKTGGAVPYSASNTGTVTVYDLTNSGTGTDSLGANLTTVRHLTIGDSSNARTFDITGKTLTVGGNFTKTAGSTFTTTSSTVVFNNAANTSTLSFDAATGFNNVTVSTGGKVVKLDHSHQTNVAGTLTVNGNSCDTQVQLISDSSGSQYSLNATGSVSVQNAYIKDSHAIAALSATNSTTGGNNTGWTITDGCGGATDDITAWSFQRKTFYDSTNDRYWRFSYDGTNTNIKIEYNQKPWTTGWSADTALTYNTNDFSVWHNGTAVYIAYADSYGIKVRKGSLGSTGITWDGSTYTALSGSGTSDFYKYAYLTQDTSNYLWVIARYSNGTNYYIKTAISAAASDPSGSWTAYSVSNTGNTNTNVYGSIHSIGSRNMYAIWVRNTNIEGMAWDNSNIRWHDSIDYSSTTPDGIASGASGLATNFSATTDTANNIHLSYIDSSGKVQYREFTVPARGISTAPTFADGFESGDFSAWTGHTNNGSSTVSVTSGAAYQGTYGLDIHIGDTNWTNASKTLTSSVTNFHERLYFNPNSISMPTNSSFSIAGAQQNGSPWNTYFVISLKYNGSNYQLNAGDATDNQDWSKGTSFYTITNAWHEVEVAWQAATAPGANNGQFSLIIDGQTKETVTGVDSDTEAPQNFWHGSGANQASGTLGDFYFDNVLIDSSNIGPYPWTDATQLDGNAGNQYVTTSVNTTNNDIYVLYLTSGNAGEYIKYNGSWGSPAATGWTMGTSPKYLTSNYADPGRVFGEWTSGTSGSFTLSWNYVIIPEQLLYLLGLAVAIPWLMRKRKAKNMLS